MNKKIFAVIVLISILFILLINKNVVAPDFELRLPSISDNSSTKLSFDKTLYSTSDPASPWIIVNKVAPIPSSYSPADLTNVSIGGQLRKEANSNLNQLLKSSNEDKVVLKSISSYRSYSRQQTLYSNYVAKDGQIKADTYSARPGHSEHQTGWAIDFGSTSCDLQECFGNTEAGKWLANNSYRFGFILRYPIDKEPITGYQYEPWHYRYVGVELAKELFETKLTMEEFFDQVPAKQPY